MEKNYKILLIDDDRATYASVKSGLSKHNYTVFWEEKPEVTKVLKSILLYKPDIILLDIIFDGENEGKSLLQTIKKSEYKRIPVIMLTNTMKDFKEEDYLHAASSYAKEGFSAGQRAYDVFAKQIMDVISGVGNIAPDDPRFGFVVGSANAMQDVCRDILEVAPTDANVLITGETGTGKELAARAVHNLSARKDRKFMAVDCGIFPEDNLLISALFGHEKGAFTDAKERKMGFFEAASGGTIFLDEIGNASLQVQARLLKVIQEKVISRLGSTAAVSIDVRIIAATNKNLKSEVSTGNFREDLFYRLNVAEIRLPPLRERGAADIEHLFWYFVGKFAEKHNKIIANIPNESLFAKLKGYDWPGNIREFENMIERAVIHAKGNVLLAGDFELPEQQAINIGTNLIADKIINCEIDWTYIRDSYKGESRKNIILEVCQRLKEREGKWPTGERLAKTFKTEWGNMRRILNDSRISLKELKKG